MKSLRVVAISGLIALAAVSGCGYQIGTMHRTDVKSIAIPTWTRGRGVFRRGIEIQLTQAIVKRVQLDTRYRITNATKADTKLTGQLVNVRQRARTINTDTGTARAKEVTFTISFKWVDLRSGDELAVREDFDVRGEYITAEPFDETFFTGSQAAIDDAAQRIVEQLEEGWPDSDGDEKL
jgi:hypothetical protein